MCAACCNPRNFYVAQEAVNTVDALSICGVDLLVAPVATINSLLDATRMQRLKSDHSLHDTCGYTLINRPQSQHMQHMMLRKEHPYNLYARKNSDSLNPSTH